MNHLWIIHLSSHNLQRLSNNSVPHIDQNVWNNQYSLYLAKNLLIYLFNRMNHFDHS